MIRSATQICFLQTDHCRLMTLGPSGSSSLGLFALGYASRCLADSAVSSAFAPLLLAATCAGSRHHELREQLEHGLLGNRGIGLADER